MLNKIALMGRLTADPELKATTSGISVLDFSIAVDRSYKTKAGDNVTDFINIIAYRSTAEFIKKYFVKGQMIALVGELHSGKYEDKEGKTRTIHKVAAEEVYFCGNKPSAPTMGTDIDPTLFEVISDLPN